MTPQQAIDALDRALAMAGQDVVLRRYLGPGLSNPVNVTCRARVTGSASAGLVDSIAQADRTVILSPTAPTAAGWPLPVRRGDKVVIGGREANVEDTDPIETDGVLVRINLRVRG